MNLIVSIFFFHSHSIFVSTYNPMKFIHSSFAQPIKIDLVDDQDECEPRSEKSCTEATNLIGESDFNLEPNDEITDEAAESFNIDRPIDTPEVMSPDQQE